MALLVFAGEDITDECAFAARLKERGIPTVAVLNQIDRLTEEEASRLRSRIREAVALDPVPVSALGGKAWRR